MMTSSKNGERFTIFWSNLNYFIEGRKRTQILHYLNGHFSSGELVALMGPSGAGKTTLLECLARKRSQGLYGSIKTSFCRPIDSGVSRPPTAAARNSRGGLAISLVPQTDHLFACFTVRESVLWASRFQNPPEGVHSVDHETVTSIILRQLSLYDCANTRVDHLSGGQRKMLSVAMELVRDTNILFLDEPTSDLDAKSCFKLIKQMSLLVNSMKASGRPIAIVITIRHPPTRVVHLFRRIYFLSIGGHAIYSGRPQAMLGSIERFGLSCPPRCDPIEFVTEIATGEYGQGIIEKLAKHTRHRPAPVPFPEKYPRDDLIKFTPAISSLASFLRQTWYSFLRGIHLTLKNRTFMAVRTLAFGITPFAVALSFSGENISTWNGCPRRSLSMWHMQYLNQPDGTPGLAEMSDDTVRTMEAARLGTNAIAFLFTAIILCVYYIYAVALLILPLERSTMVLEYHNRWYSLGAHAMGRGLAEILYHSLCTMYVLFTCCLLAGHPMEGYRSPALILLSLLVSITADTYGLLVSVLVPGGLEAAVVVGSQIMIVHSLTSDLFVRVEDNGVFTYLVRATNPCNVLIRMFAIIVYGGGRCQCGWHYVDPDDRTDWVGCWTLPDQELDYNWVCTGRNFTLTDVFRAMTSGGRYDRSVCVDHLSRGRQIAGQPMNIHEEEAIYMAQPRGIRAYKPQIYRPIPFAMLHILDEDIEFWWDAAYLISSSLIGRVMATLIFAYRYL